MSAKPLGAILNEAAAINALMPQAKRLLELRGFLSQALPEGLPQHCTVANWRRGRLVIFAENSALAAKLKLLRPALSEHFLKCGVEVTAIDIQVQPAKPVAAAPRKRSELTAAATRSLNDLSTQISDSELKSAILSLARKK